jgi:hypothetical protein
MTRVVMLGRTILPRVIISMSPLDPADEVAREQQRERWRQYVRKLLVRTGLPLERLSAVFGKDGVYVSELLATRKKRAIPDPFELRAAARKLQAMGHNITLAELLEAAWGVTPEEIQADRQSVQTRSYERLGLGELTRRELDDVELAIQLIKARRQERQSPEAKQR